MRGVDVMTLGFVTEGIGVGDLDAIEKTGFYKIWSSTVNTPTSIKQGSTVLHIQWDANAAHQVYFQMGDLALYVRIKERGEWKGWRLLQLS